VKVRAKADARLVAVAKAPPHKFAGGGYWEAMHGDMAGFFELRVDFNHHHYRLFCVLDGKAQGEPKPVLAIITGLDKAYQTTFKDREYAKVRDYRDEYLAANPRSFA
jgi:hypothetical protein